ncbi:MAG: hypothetical protein U1A78_25580 [Polyangia bacterium]
MARARGVQRRDAGQIEDRARRAPILDLGQQALGEPRHALVVHHADERQHQHAVPDLDHRRRQRQDRGLLLLDLLDLLAQLRVGLARALRVQRLQLRHPLVRARDLLLQLGERVLGAAQLVRQPARLARGLAQPADERRDHPRRRRLGREQRAAVAAPEPREQLAERQRRGLVRLEQAVFAAHRLGLGLDLRLGSG